MVGRTIPNNDEISNALCSLYAEGVLWNRNCAQMRSVTSVSSVRKRTPHARLYYFFLTE